MQIYLLILISGHYFHMRFLVILLSICQVWSLKCGDLLTLDNLMPVCQSVIFCPTCCLGLCMDCRYWPRVQ